MSAKALRERAAKLLEEAAELESLQIAYNELPRVRVVCGPCMGRGKFNRSHDPWPDMEDCEACSGRGFHLMLQHTGMVEQKFSQFDTHNTTTGWDV